MPTSSRPAARSIAADSVGPGVGEIVFFVRGREASFPWPPAEVPVDAGIVGIVDAGTSRNAAVGLDGTRLSDRNRRRMQLALRRRHAGRHAEAPEFEGAKLMLVQPVGVDDVPRGPVLLATDTVGAGVNEKV